MLVGNDHDVARGVRKSVDDDKAMLAAIEDEIALVVLTIDVARGRPIAKDAGGSAVRRGDIGIAPGSEDVVHIGEGTKARQDFTE